MGLYERLNNIYNKAFANCSSLRSILIPSSVSVIGDTVFNGCSDLTINCVRNSKPNTWSDTWCKYYLNGEYLDHTISWGYTE